MSCKTCGKTVDEARRYYAPQIEAYCPDPRCPSSSPALCPEDNRQVVKEIQIRGAIKSVQSFSMPQCDQTTTAIFDSAGDLVIGAWIWTANYGYLEIVHYNSLTGAVTLRNPCPEAECVNQATPGTTIPECTSFVVVDPLCAVSGAGGPSGVFLAASFVAPEESECVDIALTSLNGIIVGANVVINGGVYSVSAAKANNVITICNDGDGLTPATVVQAIDGEGDYITPVVLTQANPCTNTTTVSGKLMVCDSGTLRPLVGVQNNQVPVYNSSTGNAEFKTLSVPTSECTTLTASLTINPANPPLTTYPTQVVSTTAFEVGDLITIGAAQFIVDAKPSGIQINVLPVVIPGVVTTYTIGTLVCEAGCCDVNARNLTIAQTTLQGNITGLTGVVQDLKDLQFAYGFNQSGLPALLSTVGNEHNSMVGQLTITNPSASRNMKVQIHYDLWVNLRFVGASGNHGTAVLQTRTRLAGAGDAVVNRGDMLQSAVAAGTGLWNSQPMTTHYVEHATVAPGANVVAKLQSNINYLQGNLSVGLEVYSVVGRILGMGHITY